MIVESINRSSVVNSTICRCNNSGRTPTLCRLRSIGPRETTTWQTAINFFYEELFLLQCSQGAFGAASHTVYSGSSPTLFLSYYNMTLTVRFIVCTTIKWHFHTNSCCTLMDSVFPAFTTTTKRGGGGREDPLMYHNSPQTFTKGLVIVNLFERTVLLMYYRQ